MRHRYSNNLKSWSERKRIWRHPYLGVRFHDVRRGFITVTKVWKDRDFCYLCKTLGVTSGLTFEYKTDGGLRFIEEGSRLYPNIAFEDGSLPDEWMMVYGVPREAMR